MSVLRLWEPFGMLRDFDDTLENLGVFSSGAAERSLSPRADVAETDKAYEITLEVSGMEGKDLTLEVVGDFLSVSGEKKFEEKKEGKNYLTVERRYGKFSRRFNLPDTTDKKGIKADSKNGILTITVPKTQTEEQKPLKIKIN